MGDVEEVEEVRVSACILPRVSIRFTSPSWIHINLSKHLKTFTSMIAWRDNDDGGRWCGSTKWEREGDSKREGGSMQWSMIWGKFYPRNLFFGDDFFFCRRKLTICDEISFHHWILSKIQENSKFCSKSKKNSGEILAIKIFVAKNKPLAMNFFFHCKN